MKSKTECKNKIYKYTSLNSAISVLKSGGVLLNNPRVFNDPNDCVFTQEKKDKQKIEQLVTDYFSYKIIETLSDKLVKKDKEKLNFLRKEINAMKWSLDKRPFFDAMPFLKVIAEISISKKPEFAILLSKTKCEFLKRVEDAIENAKETALISCFSKRNDSILMWSHYANAHKGVCIEFERPDSIDFKDVVYSKRRPYMKAYKAVSHAIALDILGKKENEEELAKYLKDTLNPFFVKSTDWSYEEEVRCLYSSSNLNDSIKHEGDKYILNINCPKAIFVGCRASGEELDHLYKLARNRDIPVYFMKESEETFDIVVDKKRKYIPNTPDIKNISLVRLINEIDKSIDYKNYLSAFFASLIVPAICSQVETHNNDPMQRYIEWCNTYLPCSDKAPGCSGMAYLTGELIWNIKEKLFLEGTIDAYGHYDDFHLKNLTLRFEERKPFDIYVEVRGENDLVINVTKFCVDMISQAKRCLDNHEKEILKLKQLPIEDFDAELEAFNEIQLLNRKLRKRIKKENV